MSLDSGRMGRILWQYVVIVLAVCLSIHLLGNLVLNDSQQRLVNTDKHERSLELKNPLIPNENSVSFIHRNQENLNSSHFKSNSTKNIGIVFYNKPSWMAFESTVIDSTRCPNLKQKCTIYTNNKNYETSKGVVFYGEELPSKVPEKKNGQVWTFFSIESPFLYTVRPEWKNKFSWTMTYRRDSDFTYFYGKIQKREIPLFRNYSELFKKKTKKVSWAVSNCNSFSKREEYVKKLQNYISVDVYGRCGKLRCGKRSAGVTDCHKKFAEEYKFYLAVENSICKDYTTEKLFNFFFYDLPMIPIINGPKNAHEYIPNGTYINILDYASPEELAKDLERIGSNETMYSEYLKEKDKYTGSRFRWELVLCPMCSRLQENSLASSRIIPDISSWIWNDTCTKL